MNSRIVAAVVLAAGRGLRMQEKNKLLAELRGKPVICHAVETALASGAHPVIVVTGYEFERVSDALSGLDVKIVHNRRYEEGLSASLKAGIAAVPSECAGAVILLGDMPDISPSLINQLIDALDPKRGAGIVVPTRDGTRGNPVVWSRPFFDEFAKLEGDIGARHLIGLNNEVVVEVPVKDGAIFLDIDTEEALAAARKQRN